MNTICHFSYKFVNGTMTKKNISFLLIYPFKIPPFFFAIIPQPAPVQKQQQKEICTSQAYMISPPTPLFVISYDSWSQGYTLNPRWRKCEEIGSAILFSNPMSPVKKLMSLHIKIIIRKPMTWMTSKKYFWLATKFVLYYKK